MISRTINIGIIIILMAFLVNCTKHGATWGKKDKNYKVNYNGVGILNFSKDNISIEDVGSRTDGTGLLNNWVYLRNRGKYDYELNVRSIYYDHMKIPIESSEWQKIFLAENEVAQYNCNSTTKKAKYFYIEIREGL